MMVNVSVEHSAEYDMSTIHVTLRGSRWIFPNTATLLSEGMLDIRT